jgi:hypothetical protein
MTPRGLGVTLRVTREILPRKTPYGYQMIIKKHQVKPGIFYDPNRTKLEPPSPSFGCKNHQWGQRFSKNYLFEMKFLTDEFVMLW